jgi:hypothetical protein
MPELIFMKFVYISLCIYMCIPLSLLGNGSVKTLPLQRIHKQQYKTFWTHRFLCGPCRIKESRGLVLPGSSCFKRLSSLLSSAGNILACSVLQYEASLRIMSNCFLLKQVTSLFQTPSPYLGTPGFIFRVSHLESSCL